MSNKFDNKNESHPWARLPYFLIFIFGLTIALFFIYSWKTIDEGDNISVGWLLTEGKVLYTNIFSHHFPFPYFFLSLFFRVFQPSVFIARLSLILFELSAFLFLFFTTKRYSTISLTYLFWTIISRFFLGNLVLYYSFTGVSIFAIFVLAISICSENSRDGKERFTVPAILGFSTFTTISVLSDPTSAIPIFCVTLGLLITTKRLKNILIIVLAVTFLISLFILYLIVNHAVHAFIQNAIVFNHAYYLNYNSGSSNLFTTLWTFVKNFNPFSNSFALNPGGLPRNIRDSSHLIQWFFGGFYYRIVLIVFTIVIGISQKWKTAVWVLLFFISLFFRSDVFFHPISVLLISTFCSFYLLAVFGTNIMQFKKFTSSFLTLSRFFFEFLCSLMIIFFISSMVYFSILDIRKIPDQNSYSTSFGSYETKIQRISTLTCNLEDVKIASYPSDPYIYLLAKKEPFEGYLFMYPWIVDVAKEKVLLSLENQKQSFILLSIDKEGSFWGSKNADYLADYINYLDENYIQTEDGYYLSPGIYTACHTK